MSEILWALTKLFSKKMLKVSVFYLEKQKSFIPKKDILESIVNIKTKNLFLLTQFLVKVLGLLTYQQAGFRILHQIIGGKFDLIGLVTISVLGNLGL